MAGRWRRRRGIKEKFLPLYLFFLENFIEGKSREKIARGLGADIREHATAQGGFWRDMPKDRDGEDGLDGCRRRKKGWREEEVEGEGEMRRQRRRRRLSRPERRRRRRGRRENTK